MPMSPEDLRACYVQHHKRFYLAALAITLDRQAAEDAVHDALERMLTGRRTPANAPAYVMRAVRNAAIDAARRMRRMQTAEDVLVASADERCDISPRVLTAAFARLARDEREVIFLHVYADLSFREIAESRRRSINTVTTWYRRGIGRLRTILETHDERN
jgi:RNA polymerase sigma-70 factor (ECF subfamily)